MSKKLSVMFFVKGFLLTALIGAIVFAVIASFSSKGSMTFCKSEDKDQCLIQVMDMERKDRDAFVDANNKAVMEFTTQKNKESTEYATAKDATIESYKEQLKPKTIETEYKANRLQNVPMRLLRLMSPHAEAVGNTLEPSPAPLAVGGSFMSTPIVTEQAAVEIQIEMKPATNRYARVLAHYKAPYKDLPIDQYCRDAGLEQWRCDVMVSVAQQESQMGKDFHCIQQTKAHAITLGQTYYHNPMGLTDKNVHWKKGVKGKVPDFNGCFIRRFDSFEAFWRFMPQSFMDPNMRYYVGNWKTVEELSGIWVTGNKATPDKIWYTTVKGVMKRI